MKKIRILGTNVNLRAGPGLDFNIVGRGYGGEEYDWLATQIDLRSSAYTWHANAKGWSRNDLSEVFEVDDPAPLPEEYWNLGYTVKGRFEGGWGAYNGTHKGFDISNTVGSLIFGVPGGIVRETNYCAKCGVEGKSSIGIPAHQVYVDAGWGNGWGHYIVVEYASHLLPQRTQQMFPGQSGYVLYGHLSRFLYRGMSGIGQIVDSAPIAEMGSSGNSTGPHLHIEVRFSIGTGQQWRRIGPSIDPGVLFTR